MTDSVGAVMSHRPQNRCSFVRAIIRVAGFHRRNRNTPWHRLKSTTQVFIQDDAPGVRNHVAVVLPTNRTLKALRSAAQGCRLFCRHPWVAISKETSILKGLSSSPACRKVNQRRSRRRRRRASPLGMTICRTPTGFELALGTDSQGSRHPSATLVCATQPLRGWI